MTYMERYEFWCGANLPQETVDELMLLLEAYRSGAVTEDHT